MAENIEGDCILWKQGWTSVSGEFWEAYDTKPLLRRPDKLYVNGAKAKIGKIWRAHNGEDWMGSAASPFHASQVLRFKSRDEAMSYVAAIYLLKE